MTNQLTYTITATGKTLDREGVGAYYRSHLTLYPTARHADGGYCGTATVGLPRECPMDHTVAEEPSFNRWLSEAVRSGEIVEDYAD